MCILLASLFQNSGVYLGKQICFLVFWQTKMDCILYMAKGGREILFKGTIYLVVFLWLEHCF